MNWLGFGVPLVHLALMVCLRKSSGVDLSPSSTLSWPSAKHSVLHTAEAFGFPRVGEGGGAKMMDELLEWGSFSFTFEDYPDCLDAGGYPPYIGDGDCDRWNNDIEECGFDGGDCCVCTCEDGDSYECASTMYRCLDPNVPEECVEESNSPAPYRGSEDWYFGMYAEYPDCYLAGGYTLSIGDGNCDLGNSNEGCAFDGGDCCSCTCVDTERYLCGENGGYYCQDPSVSDECMEESASHIPFTSSTTGYVYSQYPGCYEARGYPGDIGNGYCDARNSIEECAYDGGDCCSCTCVSTEEFKCGIESGYCCQDPSVSRECVEYSEALQSTSIHCIVEGEAYGHGDGKCDFSNSNEEQGYDGGDCCSCTCASSSWYECGRDNGYYCLDPSVSAECKEESASYNLTRGSMRGYLYSKYPGCYEVGGYASNIGNGRCQVENNNEPCAYDGGDCCSCTCVDSEHYTCGETVGYFCEDPDVSDECQEESAAYVPVNQTHYFEQYRKYPFCESASDRLETVGNGDCDFWNSIEECGFDGGDCCMCTCVDTADNTCGENGGYYCRDPSVSAECVEESNSYIPIVSSTTGYRFSQYPGCYEVDGDAPSIGDGRCDGENNNEECAFDGGDCCPCTCVDTELTTCGENGFDCLDPTVSTDCV